MDLILTDFIEWDDGEIMSKGNFIFLGIILHYNMYYFHFARTLLNLLEF